MAQKKPVGVFTKDGNEKTAWTAAEAVDLRFRGWTEKKASRSSGSSSSDTKTSDQKSTASK